MKQSLILLILFFYSISVNGQNKLDLENYSVPSGRNEIYIFSEIGGNSLLMSFGLEHEKYKYNVLRETFRYGFSILDYSFFAEYNKEFGKNSHYFELGVGPTLLYDNRLNLFLFGRIGYRYITDKLTFRVGFTPYLIFHNGEDSPTLMSHFGVTLGIPLSYIIKT